MCVVFVQKQTISPTDYVNYPLTWSTVHRYPPAGTKPSFTHALVVHPFRSSRTPHYTPHTTHHNNRTLAGVEYKRSQTELSHKVLKSATWPKCRQLVSWWVFVSTTLGLYLSKVSWTNTQIQLWGIKGSKVPFVWPKTCWKSIRRKSNRNESLVCRGVMWE